MEQYNQFKMVRYSNPNHIKAQLTMDEVAAKLEISKGTIHSIESDRAKPSFDTLKAYHDKLQISYEYLFGDCPAKSIKNINISKELQLDDFAIESLRDLIDNTSYDRDILSLMNKFLGNSEKLTTMLRTLYRLLYEWYDAKDQYSNNKDSFDLTVGPLEYSISKLLRNYFCDIVVPVMSSSFEQHNNYLADIHAE